MSENIIQVEYERNGKTTSINEIGMREMQARAYAASLSQYILLKAPPASGKSRALMFVGLEKLRKGQVSKIIVAVPERSIGGSFKDTNLTGNGSIVIGRLVLSITYAFREVKQARSPHLGNSLILRILFCCVRTLL